MGDVAGADDGRTGARAAGPPASQGRRPASPPQEVAGGDQGPHQHARRGRPALFELPPTQAATGLHEGPAVPRPRHTHSSCFIYGTVDGRTPRRRRSLSRWKNISQARSPRLFQDALQEMYNQKGEFPGQQFKPPRRPWTLLNFLSWATVLLSPLFSCVLGVFASGSPLLILTFLGFVGAGNERAGHSSRGGLLCASLGAGKAAGP